MDSSGVGLIMGRYRLMQLYGGKLEITGASERVKKVIRLAGLEQLNILKPDNTEPDKNKQGGLAI